MIWQDGHNQLGVALEFARLVEQNLLAVKMGRN